MLTKSKLNSIETLASQALITWNSRALRCGSFSQKNIEEKHLCRHDKNYYYFCKSNIPVINLIVGSRNMVKVS